MDFGDFMSAVPAASSPQEVELDRKLYTMLEIEAKRYQNFFTTLDEQQSGLLPRDVVLAFYGKSSLSEQEINEMYQLIKSLQLQADAQAMCETEFITGMHFIVCMTKRSLAKLPPTFPKYLFPTLDLTPAPLSAPASAFMASIGISSMPSPDKDDMLQGNSMGFGAGGISAGTATTVTKQPLTGEIEKLQDSKSLHQLLEKEIHNKRVEASVLSKVDESESAALQSLHGCLHLIAENVEKLGFFVPATARALDALDDFSNLLRTHAQTTKQEIQSLEIAAQMISVTSEVSSNSGSQQRDDPFKEIMKLTEELTALQRQAAQMHERKETLLQQVNERKLKASSQSQAQPQFTQKALDVSANSSSSVMGGAAPAFSMASLEGASPPAHTTHVGVLSPVASSSSQQEVRHSESVQRTESNPFAFGTAPASAAAGGAASFGWGDFS